MFLLQILISVFLANLLSEEFNINLTIAVPVALFIMVKL